MHRPKSSGKGDGQGSPSKEHASPEEPDVKGFMTLNEVELKTGVPKSYILQKLGLNEDEVDGRKPLRDWVHEKGKSVPELREIVAGYQKPGR